MITKEHYVDSLPKEVLKQELERTLKERKSIQELIDHFIAHREHMSLEVKKVGLLKEFLPYFRMSEFKKREFGDRLDELSAKLSFLGNDLERLTGAQKQLLTYNSIIVQKIMTRLEKQ